MNVTTIDRILHKEFTCKKSKSILKRENYIFEVKAGQTKEETIEL